MIETPGTDCSAGAISIRSGDINVRVEQQANPLARQRRVDRQCDQEGELLPHLRPQTSPTRRFPRISPSAWRCDGCSAVSGKTIAPRGRSFGVIKGMPCVSPMSSPITVSQPPDEQGARISDLARLHPRAALEGRPGLVCESLRGEICAPRRSNARAKAGSPPCRKSAATNTEKAPNRCSARLALMARCSLSAEATLMRVRPPPRRDASPPLPQARPPWHRETPQGRR